MKKIIAIIIILMGLTSCTKASDDSIRVVLDWAPNTNHTGMYVAQEMGYYKDAGLTVEIVQPPEDGAIPLLASGDAQFAVDFQDSMALALASDTPYPITAIAAIVNHNTSGIVSLRETGIVSPADLQGKRFAAWGTPLEERIMRSLIESDGGNYDNMEFIPGAVTDVVSALQTNLDAVWIFYGWDGIAVEQSDLDCNFLAFRDLDPVFDYYTPVLVTNTNFAKKNPDKTKAFVQATLKGYMYASQNPKEAAEILIKQVPELDRDMIMASQTYISGQYLSENEVWGIIDSTRWGRFYDWMYENNIINKDLGETGFTNEYLLP